MEFENICIAGWLLDVYVSGLDEVTVWIKNSNGEAVSLKERWMPRLYVAGPFSELKGLGSKLGEKYAVEFVRRLPGSKASNPKNVLSLSVPAQHRPKIARLIMDLGGHSKYQVFNVDVPPEQEYLYERNLFPLANVSATKTSQGIEWRLHDDIEAFDYDTSWIKTVNLSVYPKSRRKITSFDDPLDMVTLQLGDEVFELNGSREEDILLKLVSEIRQIDPDLLLTTYGDMFALPYLVHRSSVYGIDLELGRDRGLRFGRESSYFSYGKIYYRPQGVKLFGRLHIDESNAMLYNDSELDGLYEIARICRVPLQDAARYTIGNCMTGLQYYQAYSSGILIPWRVAPWAIGALWTLRSLTVAAGFSTQ